MKSLHRHCKSKPTKALNPFTLDQCVSHYKICHVISLKLTSANITTWVCRAMLRKLFAFASRFASHMILFHHWRWTPHKCAYQLHVFVVYVVHAFPILSSAKSFPWWKHKIASFTIQWGDVPMEVERSLKLWLLCSAAAGSSQAVVTSTWLVLLAWAA